MTYWDDAFFPSDVFIINSLPFKLLKFRTPIELLFKQKPDYNFVKTFCSHMRPYNKHELQPRSALATFLGYSSHHKGYKVLYHLARSLSLGMPFLMKKVSLTCLNLRISYLLLSPLSPILLMFPLHSTWQHLPIVISQSQSPHSFFHPEQPQTSPVQSNPPHSPSSSSFSHPHSSPTNSHESNK